MSSSDASFVGWAVIIVKACPANEALKVRWAKGSPAVGSGAGMGGFSRCAVVSVDVPPQLTESMFKESTSLLNWDFASFLMLANFLETIKFRSSVRVLSSDELEKSSFISVCPFPAGLASPFLDLRRDLEPVGLTSSSDDIWSSLFSSSSFLAFFAFRCFARRALLESEAGETAAILPSST